jgi:hypothetical protein
MHGIMDHIRRSARYELACFWYDRLWRLDSIAWMVAHGPRLCKRLLLPIHDWALAVIICRETERAFAGTREEEIECTA